MLAGPAATETDYRVDSRGREEIGEFAREGYMKTYRGSRERGKVWIESAEYEGGWRDLPLRLDVFNHSPSGFERGYLGSGPAQLALAILCDYLGEPQLAVRFYREFKEDIVARWKGDEWTLTEHEIAEWFTQSRPR